MKKSLAERLAIIQFSEASSPPSPPTHFQKRTWMDKNQHYIGVGTGGGISEDEDNSQQVKTIK